MRKKYELMPCPFCGGEAVITVDITPQNGHDNTYFVECKGCGDLLGFIDYGGQYLSREEAILAWNKRPVRWIKVEDELPEYRHAVLVYCPETLNIYCAYYTGDKEAEGFEKANTWYYYGQQLFTAVQEKVTQWMGLPRDPEEKS